MYSQSALSTEYISVPVAATVSGVAINPSTDVVQMAFVSAGDSPDSGDWVSASWEQDATGTPTVYSVRALVGPTGGVTTLTAGTLYDVFVKIGDNPETVVRRFGAVSIF